MKRSLRILATATVILSALVSLTGCGGQKVLMRSSFVEFSPEQQRQIEDQGLREYRIQEGDMLYVAFPYEKNLDQSEIIVLNDGAISLVGIDRVPVAGLTVSEADSAITAAYAREYREPDLSIIIQKTAGRRIHVLGQVREPGLHSVPATGFNLIGAVSAAGGFGEHASPENTMLIRVSETGYMVQEVNLGDIGNVESAALATLQLLPNDIVYVPRSHVGDFGYFARNVLAGLTQITRIASDVRYMADGASGRY